MEKLEINHINDLHRLIKNVVEQQRGKYKLLKNCTQVQIISYLISKDGLPVYQKDIGEALKLKKSSITEHLDYLESVGAIERVQDENDKRRNSIRLSSITRNRKAEIDDIIKRINDKILNGISEEEIINFKKVIKKMEDNLKNSI